MFICMGTGLDSGFDSDDDEHVIEEVAALDFGAALDGAISAAAALDIYTPHLREALESAISTFALGAYGHELSFDLGEGGFISGYDLRELTFIEAKRGGVRVVFLFGGVRVVSSRDTASQGFQLSVSVHRNLRSGSAVQCHLIAPLPY